MSAATRSRPSENAQFDAVLYPHRSLGRAGFIVLMLAIVGLSAAIGAGFVLVGAWPVTGFLGLDVLLLYLAFRCNYREARLLEFIRLDQDGLRVRRVEPDGRAQEWRFEPYWVRVEVDRPLGRDSQLRLCCHGRELVLGAFLSIEERLALAAALGAALDAKRAPG